MSAYPSIVAKPMAVEPTTALESAAAQLEMDQQVLLSSAEVERPSLKQRSVHNHACTLMSMLCLVPNICRVSHSLYVPERVFPLYNKTGIAHFCKNMESPPVAPVPPKCIPRHSRGTPEALPRHCRGTAEALPSSLPLAAREDPFSSTFWNLPKPEEKRGR